MALQPSTHGSLRVSSASGGKAPALIVTAALSLAAALGCEASNPAGDGTGGSNSGLGGSGGSGGGSGSGSDACKAGISVAPTPLRRLTHAEYDNAARALLGTQLTPSRDLPSDFPLAGFASNRGDGPSFLGVEKLMLAAEALAKDAVARIDSVVPCAAAQRDAACARSFFEGLARRAYRRSPDAAELAELAQLYSWGETNGGFSLGIQVVIERILESPHFVYHVERTVGAPLTGPKGAVAQLSGLSVADRLATLLWHSLPDTQLLDAAERGELDTAAGIAAQIDRMLQDARGRDGIVEFFNQWLDIEKLSMTEKNSAVYPGFTAASRDAMWEETASFVDDVVRKGDASIVTLLTSAMAMPSAPLAPLYGLSPGAGFVAMDAKVRSGLLTHPSVLAVHAHSDQSSPVRRGAFIRARILCTPLPDPPPSVNANPPVVSGALTTRQRFEQHRANPTCASCHDLIDPVGFAFERYDGIGLYRSQEGALPIDTSGKLTGTDVDGDFQDGIELTQRFATSQQVRDCMATQWLRFAVRREETAADDCTQQQLRAAFRKSGNLKELVTALVQSDAFRFKTTTAP